jgi:hypothetical protein
VAARGVTRFPALPVVPQDHGSGRPGLADLDRDRVEYAAWLADVKGCNAREIARRLHGTGRREDGPTPHGRARRHDRKPLVTERELKQSKRDIAAGRRSLHDHGVLPWAVYDAGSVPRRWWVDETFWQAIRAWEREAILHPQPPEEPPLAVSLHRHQERLESIARLLHRAATRATSETDRQARNVLAAATMADRLARAVEVPLRSYPTSRC